MRGRRGRHCPPLRRSAQCRCLASGPGRKRLDASRDSPGSRRARLELKQPHLLSRRPLPASLSPNNDPDALASGRRRATGHSRALTTGTRSAEGSRPSAPAPERRRRQSQAARPLAILERGGARAGREQCPPSRPALSRPFLCSPVAGWGLGNPGSVLERLQRGSWLASVQSYTCLQALVFPRRLIKSILSFYIL